MERETHPELFAISEMEQATGKEQKQHCESEILKPARDILEKGPLNFSEAYSWGLVDAPMYHQDLLAMLAEAGIKTWSVRKYLDAMIAQSIFGDIDRTKWVLPQLFKQGKEGSFKDKQGKAVPAAGEGNQGLPGVKLDLSLVSTIANPKLEDTSLKLEVVIPRTVGLVYLDSAIEGYGISFDKADRIGKDDLAEKQRRHTS